MTRALAPGSWAVCTLRRPGGRSEDPDPENPLGLCRPRQKVSQQGPVIPSASLPGLLQPCGRTVSSSPDSESPGGGTVAQAPAGPQRQGLIQVFVVLN